MSSNAPIDMLAYCRMVGNLRPARCTLGIPCAATSARGPPGACRSRAPVLESEQASGAALHERGPLAVFQGNAGLLPRVAAAIRGPYLLPDARQFRRIEVAGLGGRRLAGIPVRSDRQHVRRASGRLYFATDLCSFRRRWHKAA